MNFGFVKDFWEELKIDFVKLLKEFHANGKLIRGTNSSFIILIPKFDNSQGLNEFYPISLIRCVYKVLAKVLANRLKQVIHSVISERQSTFVARRQILDDIFAANEIIDEAQRKKK